MMFAYRMTLNAADLAWACGLVYPMHVVWGQMIRTEKNDEELSNYCVEEELQLARAKLDGDSERDQWSCRGRVFWYYHLRWRTGITLICFPAGEDKMYDTECGVLIMWMNKQRRDVGRYYQEKMGGIEAVVWSGYCSGCTMWVFVQEVTWSRWRSLRAG